MTGVHTVGLHQLLKAPEGLLSKGSSEHQTQDIKTVLKELGLSQLPVLPVITTREWQGTVHEEDRFIIVGGQNLFNAVCDLAADIDQVSLSYIKSFFPPLPRFVKLYTLQPFCNAP